MAYEIVDNNWNDFFLSLEEYVKKINKKDPGWGNNKQKLIKDDIVDLVAKEFKGLKILEEKKLKEMIPTGEMKEFSIKKIKEGDTIKITIKNIDNFLKARVRKWLDPILPKDSKKLETLILGTFPWVKTLNENSGNTNICYYLDSRNIFRLMLWIIYDDRFENEDNPAIKTYLDIGKGESKEIAGLQKKFVNKVKTIGIWDAVHICYITPLKSKDKSRICLVPSWLNKLDIKNKNKNKNYKILFNWRDNKLNKFVDSGKTFDTSDKESKYIHCSSTSGASSSGEWLRLFEWAYHLLTHKDDLNNLNKVNINLVNLINKYESNKKLVKKLYSMMALFNIWYSYLKDKTFNDTIKEITDTEGNELLDKVFKKKLKDNVDLFLTWKMDD